MCGFKSNAIFPLYPSFDLGIEGLGVITPAVEM